MVVGDDYDKCIAAASDSHVDRASRPSDRRAKRHRSIGPRGTILGQECRSVFETARPLALEPQHVR